MPTFSGSGSTQREAQDALLAAIPDDMMAVTGKTWTENPPGTRVVTVECEPRPPEPTPEPEAP